VKFSEIKSDFTFLQTLRTVSSKKFSIFYFTKSSTYRKNEKKLKKNLVSLKKCCIFASRNKKERYVTKEEIPQVSESGENGFGKDKPNIGYAHLQDAERNETSR
jgi:hypothetical protein